MIIHIDNKTMKCQKYIKGIVICLLVLVPREILHLHGSIEEHHDHLHGFCDFFVPQGSSNKFYIKNFMSKKVWV